MALPNLPTTYTTHKNAFEAAIVRRRNHENDFKEAWADTAKYFAQNDVKATKQNAWTSKRAYMDSMDAYRSIHEREIKALELKQRKIKLAHMLKEEANSFEAELRGESKDNYERLTEMQQRTEELQSAREEKRQQLAEELLYDHWRQNNPDIRELEFDQHKRHVMEQWKLQKQERKEVLDKAKKEQEIYEKQQEEDRKVASEQEQENKSVKFHEERELKKHLMEQVKELQLREQEAAVLKTEEEEIQKQLWELQELEEERKKLDEERKKDEFRRVLLRQHTAQMRRKSKLIQEELELDHKILQQLSKEEKKEKEVMTARREKQKKDAGWMKQVIEDQLKVEKTREAELDMLYQDEAARIWQQREAEWAREREARQRLMNEVLDARHQQIERQRDELRIQQEESIERREQLLKEIEISNELSKKDQEKAEAMKEEVKKDLEAQITTRRDQQISARQCLEDELDSERRAEDAYEDMLRQEAERMNLEGFRPKIRSRPGGNSTRRQAWD